MTTPAPTRRRTPRPRLAAPQGLLALRASAAPGATACLAPGPGIALPRLTDVPSTYRAVGGDTVALCVARSLLEAGVGDPADWAGDGAAFVERTLDQVIAAHGGAQIEAQFTLHCALVRHADEGPGIVDEAAPEDPVAPLYLTVEPEVAGFVLLGETVRRLEAVHPRLAATFVKQLLKSLRRVISVYDYAEAAQLVGRWADSFYGCPPHERPEFPDVKGSIPRSVRRTPFERPALQALLADTNNPDLTRLFAALDALTTEAEAFSPPFAGESFYEDLDAPLPCLLAVFARHDAITACFDEEAQGMYEASRAPAVVIPMLGTDAAAVAAGITHLIQLCRTLSAASTLFGMLPGNDTTP